MEKFSVEVARQWTNEARLKVENNVYGSIKYAANEGKDSVTLLSEFEQLILKDLRELGFTVLTGTPGQTVIKWKEA